MSRSMKSDWLADRVYKLTKSAEVITINRKTWPEKNQQSKLPSSPLFKPW